jgi:hypothetical protein
MTLLASASSPVSQPTPSSTVAATPTAIPTPAATPTPKPQNEYALVWYNHFEPNTLYKVNFTDITKPELRNNEFRQFCSPLDLSHKRVISREEVAGDERFKGPREPNWWTKPPYNLPALTQRWLNIMDDERWYVLTSQNE